MLRPGAAKFHMASPVLTSVPVSLAHCNPALTPMTDRGLCAQSWQAATSDVWPRVSNVVNIPWKRIEQAAGSTHSGLSRGESAGPDAPAAFARHIRRERRSDRSVKSRPVELPDMLKSGPVVEQLKKDLASGSPRTSAVMTLSSGMLFLFSKSF